MSSLRDAGQAARDAGATVRSAPFGVIHPRGGIPYVPQRPCPHPTACTHRMDATLALSPTFPKPHVGRGGRGQEPVCECALLQSSQWTHQFFPPLVNLPFWYACDA